MKNVAKIKSQPSNYAKNWMIFGAVFFCFMAYLSRNHIFNNTYIDLIGLAVFLGLLGFAILCLNYLINKTEIEITPGTIISKNKVRKRIYSNIKGFKEESYDGQYQSGDKLVFKTEKGFVVIDSNDYSNYFEMASYTRRNFKKLDDTHFKKYDNKDVLILKAFFLLAALFSVGIFMSKQFSYVENEIVKTQITLSEAPKMESKGGRTQRDYIRAFAKNNPEFIFKIQSNRFKACNRRSLLNDLKRGDEVEISIDQNTYDSKILKSKEPSFSTKYFHWEQINIYQIEHKKKKYIDLDRLKEFKEEDKIWSWGFLLFGILSFCLIFKLKT